MMGFFPVKLIDATVDEVIERLSRPVEQCPHALTEKNSLGKWSVSLVYRDYPDSMSLNDLSTLELGWRVRKEGDRYDDIDKRLAMAVCETSSFADYIGV